MKNDFSSDEVIEYYYESIETVGLWKSEECIFNKYVCKNDKILDIGCGAGRTTFGLYNKGFKNIFGIDLENKMIKAALKYKNNNNYTDLKFECMDALLLELKEKNFDVAFFSFNGYMQIPYLDNRIKLLNNISKHLKENGIFIFTTLDRNNPDFTEFWKEEEVKWHNRTDNKLEQLGDLIIEDGNRKYYMHIPDQTILNQILIDNGFEVIEMTRRSNIAKEKESVLDFGDDCLFWITRKISNE